MKMYITLTKKSIAALFAAILIILVLLGMIYTVKANETYGDTNENRVKYLETLGYSPYDTPVSEKEITIPEQFNSVYTRYNTLQREAGFDLTLYRGKTATLYTYRLKNTDCVANIIVRKGCIIGGDISTCNIDGEMTALKNK